MPRYPIDRATNFIVEEESWTVVEYDHTSVPGVIYLSLTEGKVNSIYDDLVNNIADTDKLANYTIDLPAEKQTFLVNDVINPSFTLIKNGSPVEMEVNLLPTDKKKTRLIDGQLVAVGEGETTIIIQLKDYPSISDTIDIVIGEPQQEFSGYIEGADKIRLDRIETYYLRGTADIIDNVEFSLNTNFAEIIDSEGNHCTIKANSKNLLGNFTLTATYNGVQYEKNISVIPLW